MKLEKECRICTHYEHRVNRNGCLDSFKCDQGYFDFKVQRYTIIIKGKKIIKRYPYGTITVKSELTQNQLPCYGIDFKIYSTPKSPKLKN